MSERRWVLRQPDGQAVRALEAAGCPGVLARLLANRGISRPEEARAFLSGRGPETFRPMRMKGMAAAVERIRTAVSGGEKIVVYGDYDVDGVTATALLLSYLQGLGAHAEPYIPQREGEGYGLNSSAVRQIYESGVSLIVTVDTGISAFEEARLCRELKLDLIVTDHHEPRGELPGALAVIDPKQPDCSYPFKELAGVGVAYKLACAIEGRELFERFADFVTLGTVADVVPLAGENRELVRRGLQLMRKKLNPGVAALLRAAGAQDGAPTARLLSFTVAPRLNAAGRMGSADDALMLLLEKDGERAESLAARLETLNRLRQETESRILAEAVEKIGPDGPGDPVLIVGGEGWHCGVIGIVASRLSERYAKPSVVVSFEGDTGRASCRSFEGFNIHDALMECGELLDRFGGHELAAGFTLRRENYNAFCTRLQDYARGLGAIPSPALPLECELYALDLTEKTARDLRLLEPCGQGNPEPLFFIRGARVVDTVPLKEGRHLRLTIKKDEKTFSAVAFQVDKAGIRVSKGEIADFAVNLELNCFRGAESLSVIVRDARVSCVFDEDRRLFERLCGQEAVPAPAKAPGREDFTAVYRYLLRQKGSAALSRAYGEILCEREDFSFFKLLVILHVFKELGLIRFEAEGDSIRFEINRKIRINLEESALMQRLGKI